MLRRRTVTAALSGTVLALSALGGLPGSATAAGQHPTAIDSASPLSLWAPSKMEAYSYDGYTYTDFGLKLVAGDSAVEIRAHRPDYSQPINAAWENAPGGPRALPEGSMTTFSGLDDFATVTVRSVATGKKVSSLDLPGCFNGYGTQRIDPNGPARSPYPTSCPFNPYTVGSVMGIQADYATPLMQDYGMEMQLKPGKYDVTSKISPTWVDFFGISAEAAQATSRLTVIKDNSGCCGRTKPSPAQTLKPANSAAPSHPSAAAPDASTEPDLRALPSFGIMLNRKGTQLRFGATVWNAGPAPMVVDGYRSTTDADHMDAYQYFYDADGNEVSHQEVGQMHWHAGNHNHWHFEDFARYRLLNADQTEAVKSGKQSFCLAPTDPVDLTQPGADMQQEITDLGSACGGYDALAVREALPAGWGDTYYQFRTGQAFNISKIPNGVYYISVEANPLGTLFETDTTNNNSLRKIKLFTSHGQRQVKVFQVGIIDESLGWGGGMFRHN